MRPKRPSSTPGPGETAGTSLAGVWPLLVQGDADGNLLSWDLVTGRCSNLATGKTPAGVKAPSSLCLRQDTRTPRKCHWWALLGASLPVRRDSCCAMHLVPHMTRALQLVKASWWRQRWLSRVFAHCYLTYGPPRWLVS